MSQIEKAACIIRYSDAEEMMQIENGNGEIVFYGNNWDFSRNPVMLKQLFESLGINVETFEVNFHNY